MKEESKLIELFKKYPGIAARIRRSITILFPTRYQGILRNRTYRDSRAYINRIQNSHPKQRNQMKKNQLLIDNLRTHILQSLENLEELLEQEDINLRTLRIKELEISFTVTRRTKSEYLKSLDFWYNPLTNHKEYQISLQK